MKALWFITLTQLCCYLFSQNRIIKEDFIFEEKISDTIYLAEDQSLESNYLVFHSKKELLDHYKNSNQVNPPYQFTVQEFPERYIATTYFVLDNYRNYKESQNQSLDESFDIYDWWNLNPTEQMNFLNHLSKEWKVSFELQSNHLETYTQSYLFISRINWEKKIFIDQCNALLEIAFDGKPPFVFTNEGINFQEFKSIFWEDLKNIQVNRTSKQLVLKNHSGNQFEFPYPPENYSAIADFHVQFSAGFNSIQSKK